VISHAIYRDLPYVFVAALLGGVAARKLRQPLIVGYVLGGIVVGPFTPGPTVSDMHALELFAEIGVILLMYSIGIEFSLRDLLSVKWVSAVGGPLGIWLSIGLGLGIGWLLGWSAPQAVGASVSVASTMGLSRLLMDRGELQSVHGRIMIAITLVEGLAVVVLTILLPSLKNFSPSSLATVGRSGQSRAHSCSCRVSLVPSSFRGLWLKWPALRIKSFSCWSPLRWDLPPLRSRKQLACRSLGGSVFRNVS
jgi:CPA2 family monovalent cation:H+ antiporter-2